MVTVIINLTGEHWAYIQTLNIRHYKLLINFKWYPELKNAWVYTFHKCFRFTAGKLNRTVQSLTAVYKNLDLVMNKRSHLPQTADRVYPVTWLLPSLPLLVFPTVSSTSDCIWEDWFSNFSKKIRMASIIWNITRMSGIPNSGLSEWKLSAHYLVNTYTLWLMTHRCREGGNRNDNVRTWDG